MNSAKEKAKKFLDEAKKASSLTGNEDMSQEIKQVIMFCIFCTDQ